MTDNPIIGFLRDEQHVREANKRKKKEIQQNTTCKTCSCSKCAKNCIYDLSEVGVCVGCRRCKESNITKAFITCPMQMFEKLRE